MFNLFDILQGGAGMQAIGQQYGLSPEQSRRAVEALLPALTIGLQRNAAVDPIGFGRLFGLAGPDAQPAKPDLLLGQLFGSPAISQAVLQQAASASGIGTQALRQILPVMAGMIVAGIVHVMLNQNAAPQPAMPEIRPPAAPDFPAMAFWNDWLGSLQSASAKVAPAPTAAAEPAPEPRLVAPEKPKPDDGSGEDISLKAFQQMFETGVQVQEQNVKAMQEIFDRFWSSPPEAAPMPASTAESDPPKAKSQPRKATDGTTRG